MSRKIAVPKEIALSEQCCLMILASLSLRRRWLFEAWKQSFEAGEETETWARSSRELNDAHAELRQFYWRCPA